jgi:hypothetical protein
MEIKTRYNLPILMSQRATSGQQLWVSGCSFANGLELQDQNDRYGQVVSDALKIPVSFLSQGGSSIEWAADQIIRSDIRANDIVVWGITGTNRLLHFNKDGSLLHLTPEKFNHDNPWFHTITNQYTAKEIWIRIMHEQPRLNHGIRMIEQVSCFCAKINANLVLCCHSELSTPDQAKQLLDYLERTGNYLDLYQKLKQPSLYLDYATDNRHPGPATHKMWAESIIDYIQNKGFINET